MPKRAPGLVSGNGGPSLSRGHKQIAQQMLPSRHTKAQLVGGDLAQRTLGNYAKQAPTNGPNINEMAGPPLR